MHRHVPRNGTVPISKRMCARGECAKSQEIRAQHLQMHSLRATAQSSMPPHCQFLSAVTTQITRCKSRLGCSMSILTKHWIAMPRRAWTPCVLLALTSSGLALGCWDQAATLYRLNPDLLYAIAKCESGLRPTATNRPRAGTHDIGLMQINSSHLRELATFGITERQLYDACTNIHVGAWILAEMIRIHGFSWEAVGAYNAACTRRKGKDCEAARSKYAWCVFRNLP